MSKPEDPADMADRLLHSPTSRALCCYGITVRSQEIARLITAALDSPDAFELLRALAEDLRGEAGK